MSPVVWRRIGWIAGVIAAAVVIWWIAEHIPRTISIFVIAAFIAFGVQPIAVRLERHMPKPLAITIVFAALLLLIAVGLTIVVPLTIDQTQQLAANIPAYAAATESWVNGLEAQLMEHFPQLHIPSNALDLSHVGSSQVTTVVTGTIASIGTIAVNTMTALFMAFSAIILSFFFLLYDSQVAEGFAAMFPPARRETARKLAAEVTQVFGSYISGQVIVSAITGAVIAILSAIIGFKFSLIIGIVAGVAYAIPIIGMLIAEIIAVPLCVPQGLFMVVAVQVIMFGMARVSDNVLVPKIMGESVGVSPIGAMFAVFAGGELFGIPGLILGIPAAALIKIVWRYFVAPWLHSQFETPAAPAAPAPVPEAPEKKPSPRSLSS
ncbi:MAG TPA: AI-2E family transporter [Candidatus Acidoferrales bacterium]|jgi:predicted PurR-regulated permease PerM|nr:AI-2E family transporter [Candidatus Acidoferrales bacterium]